MTKRKTTIVKHTKRLEEYIGKEKSDKLKELHFDSLVRRGVNRLKVKRSIGTKISISTV